MEPGQTGFGLVLMGAGVVFVALRNRLASEIYRYYNSIPDPRWRPRWLPVQFRPTQRQARIILWLAVLALWGVGTLFVLVGAT